MGKVTQLKNHDSISGAVQKVYPKTLTRAVFDDNGKSLNDYFDGEYSNITLYASNWNNSMYTVSDPRITLTSVQDFIPAVGITDEQLEALQNANITSGGQATGSAYLVAHGDVPEIDIPITVIYQPGLNLRDVDPTASNITYDNTESGMEATDVQEAIDILSTGKVYAKIYAFHISGSESSPSNAVTYMNDAVGMTPASMNTSSGVFSYGSWENAFFMPKPCMVKYDGTVDYYLDPSDYTKKADGTASDIADTSYAGNAMMEWGQNGNKIWYKIVPDVGDANSATVYISDKQVDTDYVAWSFMNNQGEYVDHFYTAIYNGSYDSSNRIRSLSGQKAKQSLTGSAEITACELNNPSTDKLWYTDVYCDRVLINLLLILMGKSIDTQTVFGQGLTSGDQTALNNYTTGALDDKGLFYGYSDTTHGVKVFGMENWWGAQWRRTAGLNMNSGNIKYKMYYPYSEASTGYIATGVTPGGTSGGYISKMRFNKEAMYANTVSGGSSTYFCDGQWWNTSDNRWSLFGGGSYNGALCGTFYCVLSSPLSNSGWDYGCCLSLKPLA